MKRNNILLLVLSLLAASALAAVTLASDDDSLDKRIEKGPPDPKVRWARSIFLDRKEGARDWKMILRAFVVESPGAWVERNRQHVERQLWPLEFREGFRTQINWKNKILTMAPDDIFEMGLTISISSPSSATLAEGTDAIILSGVLVDMAVRLGSPRAGYHRYRGYTGMINDYRAGKSENSPDVTCDDAVLPLWRAARSDHLNAIRWIIYEYRSGNCVTIDLPKAYYWTLRAQERRNAARK